MNFAQLLIQFRKRSGLNKTDLARRLKISLGYVQHVESERRKPFPIEKCSEIAKILNLTQDESKIFIDTAIKERAKPETTEWLDSNRKLQEVPILPWTVADRFENEQDLPAPGLADEYVIVLTKKGGCMFALRVNSDSMETMFKVGDVIVINPKAEALLGQFVVVRDVEKNKSGLKQLIKKDGKLYLHHLNPKYKDIELDVEKKHKIVGKMVEKHTIEKF